MINLIAFGPFASPLMLLWGLVAVVPLLIHLWSRRRYDEVPFAAMEFLLAAIRKNARRWRFERLLLLAVRILILLLLAAALADPILALFNKQVGTTGTTGDTHLVIVVDASYSMDYRRDDLTRFDQAKALAGDVVRESIQGDGFTLVTMASPPQVVVAEPVYDRAEMAREIAELRRTDGGAPLLATLVEVDRVIDLAKEKDPRLLKTRVCFFTDMGRTTWGEVGTESVQSMVARLGDKADLRVFDVGRSGGQNVAVTSVAAADALVTVGHPIRFDIELENFGNQDQPQHRVEVLVDGQRITEDSIDLPAGERGNLAAIHRFQMPGDHVIEVRSGSDPLEVDNHRWQSLSVRSAMEVLCVEGQSGAARNVALALEPGLSQHPRVRTVVLSEIALIEEDLHRYDCVFLCNIGRFGRDEAQLLSGFLGRGGGIVCILGDQVQPSNYNSILGVDAGADGLLPARLLDPVATSEYFFDPLEYRHSIVAPFRGHQRAGLLTTPVWKYIGLELPADAQVRKVLAFENGDPAMLEQSVGSGNVVLLATDASGESLDRSTDPPTPWSAMAAWPSFPPLIQQMLRSAVRGRIQLKNVVVGDAIRGAVPPGNADASVVINDPAQGSRRVPVEIDGGESSWNYTQTYWSGVYAIRLGVSNENDQRYSVNLDTRESRLECIETDLLPSAFGRAESDEPSRAPLVRAGPTRFFRHLLAAVLGLLLAESFMAWFFGRSAA